MDTANNEIEYIEVVDVPDSVRRVKKQMWNGASWQETHHYRVHKHLSTKERAWLVETFGPADVYKLGQFWSFKYAQDYIVMDEPIYMMYCLKWGNR
jgi:hypothetical protein